MEFIKDNTANVLEWVVAEQRIDIIEFMADNNILDESGLDAALKLAGKCEIQLSYAIGVARPTSIMVDTFGTGKLDEEKIVEIIRENFDLRPNGIIKMLDLRRPIYKQTAAYGHFGRTGLNLPWEKLDKGDVLAKYLA